MMEGVANYGMRRTTLGEWVTLLKPVVRDQPCRAMLGCPGEAVGHARNRVNDKLVLACDLHRHRGRW